MEQQELKRKIAATIAATVTLCVLLGASVLLLATTQVFTAQVKILMLVCCGVLAVAIIGFLRNKLIEIRTLRLCMSTANSEELQLGTTEQVVKPAISDENGQIMQNDNYTEQSLQSEQHDAPIDDDAEFFKNIMPDDNSALAFDNMQYEQAFEPQVNEQAFEPQVNEQTVAPQVNEQAFEPQVNEQTFAPQVNEQAFVPGYYNNIQPQQQQNNTQTQNIQSANMQQSWQSSHNNNLPQNTLNTQQVPQNTTHGNTNTQNYNVQNAPVENIVSNRPKTPLPFTVNENSSAPAKQKSSKTDYALLLKQYSQQTAQTHAQQRNASVERAQQRASEIKSNYNKTYSPNAVRPNMPAGTNNIPQQPNIPVLQNNSNQTNGVPHSTSPYAKAKQIYGNLPSNTPKPPAPKQPEVPKISAEEIEREMMRREEEKKHQEQASEAMAGAKQAAARQQEAAAKAQARLRALIGAVDEDSTAPVNINTGSEEISWKKQL